MDIDKVDFLQQMESVRRYDWTHESVQVLFNALSAFQARIEALETRCDEQTTRILNLNAALRMRDKPPPTIAETWANDELLKLDK